MQTVQLATLPGTLVLDSQDVAAVCAHLGVPADDITGAVVEVGDGDYRSVWLTESATPYLLDARYYRAR